MNTGYRQVFFLGPVQSTKFAKYSCNTRTWVTAKPFNHENVLHVPTVSHTATMYTQCIELWSYKIITPHLVAEQSSCTFISNPPPALWQRDLCDDTITLCNYMPIQVLTQTCRAYLDTWPLETLNSLVQDQEEHKGAA